MGEVAHEGMALRDYFAAKAMQGFMANKSNPMHYQPETDAQWAYMIANAMLKAREA
jgi:beta-N-acetylglucosaminidase